MNQKQREFLIKKIQESVKSKVGALEKQMPEAPSLSAILNESVLNGTFELKPIEEIKTSIIDNTLRMQVKNQSLLASDWRGSKPVYGIYAEHLFVIPEKYKNLKDKYDAKVADLRVEISELNRSAESLIVRIQLASDKTLDVMISEVDDMGNVSLMDTKLKLLGSSQS